MTVTMFWVIVFIPAAILLLVDILLCRKSIGSRRLGKRRGFYYYLATSIVLFVLAVWYVAYVWALDQMIVRLPRCKITLTRSVYLAAYEYSREHPESSIPARWVGRGKEPRCHGWDLPYVYAEAPNLEGNGATDSEMVIAWCPKAHRRYWWVLWNPLDYDEDRAVLYGRWVKGVAEKEFHSFIAEHTWRPLSKDEVTP